MGGGYIGMSLKATWKTFYPSYLSPLTSLRRVTLKPNFSQDYIIFSLSVYSQKRLFPWYSSSHQKLNHTISFVLYQLLILPSVDCPLLDFSGWSLKASSSINFIHRLGFNKESSSVGFVSCEVKDVNFRSIGRKWKPYWILSFNRCYWALTM